MQLATKAVIEDQNQVFKSEEKNSLGSKKELSTKDIWRAESSKRHHKKSPGYFIIRWILMNLKYDSYKTNA